MGPHAAARASVRLDDWPAEGPPSGSGANCNRGSAGVSVFIKPNGMTTPRTATAPPSIQVRHAAGRARVIEQQALRARGMDGRRTAACASDPAQEAAMEIMPALQEAIMASMMGASRPRHRPPACDRTAGVGAPGRAQNSKPISPCRRPNRRPAACDRTAALVEGRHGGACRQAIAALGRRPPATALDRAAHRIVIQVYDRTTVAALGRRPPATAMDRAARPEQAPSPNQALHGAACGRRPSRLRAAAGGGLPAAGS